MSRLRKLTRSLLPYVLTGFCIFVIIALLLPAIQSAREAARRSSSKNNLKQLGLAFHNYHDVYGMFPIGGSYALDGTPQHGWPLRLAPFIDSSPLYNYFNLDLPWNDPFNRIHSQSWLPCFLSPKISLSTTSRGYPLLHYPGNAQLLPDNASIGFGEIEVGTSNVWICVETFDHWQPWATPFNTVDLDWPPQVHPDESPYTGEGTHLLLADGSVVYSGPERKQLLAIVSVPEWKMKPQIPSLRQETPQWEYRGFTANSAANYNGVRENSILVDDAHFLWENLSKKETHQRLMRDLKALVKNSPDAKILKIGMDLNSETLPFILKLEKLESLIVEKLELSDEELNQLSRLEHLSFIHAACDVETESQLRTLLPECELRLFVHDEPDNSEEEPAETADGERPSSP